MSTDNCPITDKLIVVDGDILLSLMQTLTIPVNTVGVMGKGLALQTKRQFPDVHAAYRDACKRHLLQMGKPYLYKREGSLDEELADEPASLVIPNASKWFLLFPTKKHWKERSDPANIEKGLQWLVEHYKAEGIQSIAMPALGCGLGGLDWEEIYPLMCRYLAQMDIPAAIYRRHEKSIWSGFLPPKGDI